MQDADIEEVDCKDPNTGEVESDIGEVESKQCVYTLRLAATHCNT